VNCACADTRRLFAIKIKNAKYAMDMCARNALIFALIKHIATHAEK
jgi:hypothetical protein